jgi:hypothetical protein
MNYPKIVKSANAIFISVNYNVLRFQAEPGGKILSLYTSAVRSPEDIKLAVKAFRESRELDGWHAGV